MAELAIKIGDAGPSDTSYKDGDILCAFSDRHIKQVHAQTLCDVRHFGFTTAGLRPSNSLAEKYLTKTKHFMFERISAKEVRRTNLITFETDIVSDQPNAKNEAIHVALFLARRRTNLRHKIFGEEGAERWYGGKTRHEESVIDSIWDDIEAHSPEVRTDFTLWPAGYQDIRSHLIVRTTNFTEEEVQELVSPRYELDQDGEKILDGEGQPIVLAKRNVHTNWRNLLRDLGVSEADVLNRTVPVGKEVVLPRQSLRWASKDQPVQDDRALLGNKAVGRAPI